MQLILDAESPSVNIKEKMATLSTETVVDNSLSNGDMKEVNRSQESNGTSDKENVESHDNSLNKADECEQNDENGDHTSPKNPKEALKPIQELPSELSSMNAEKQNEEDGNQKEKVVLNEEKILDEKNTQVREKETMKESENIVMTDNNTKSESDCETTQSNVTEDQELEETDKLELDNTKKIEQEKALEQEKASELLELEKKETMEINETNKAKLYETNNIKLDTTNSLELKESENCKSIEIMEVEQTEKFEQNSKMSENAVDTEKQGLDKKEGTGQIIIDSLELKKTDEPVDNNKEHKGSTLENKIEHSRIGEVSNNAENICGVTEKPQIAETQLEKDLSQETDNSEMNMVNVEKILLTAHSPTENEISEEPLNNDIITEKTHENNKVDEMEVDEGDSFTDHEFQALTEKHVTESISEMVENIVQTLNEDKDDLMDADDLNTSEDKESLSSKADNNIKGNATKNSLENPEAEAMIEDKTNTFSEDFENITQIEEKKNLEVDEKQDPDEVNQIPKRVESVDNALSSQQKMVNDDIIKDIEISQESIKDIESAVLTCDENIKEDPKNIGDDINSEILSVKEDNSNENIKEAPKNVGDDINSQISSVKEGNSILLNYVKVADVTDSSSVVEKFDNKDDKIEAFENISEVIDVKSCDSSMNNLENSELSMNKDKDEIVKSSKEEDVNEKEITDKTSSDVVSEITEKESILKTNVLDDTSDVEEIKLVDVVKHVSQQAEIKAPEKVTPLIKLSNTMDILSDEEEEPSAVEPTNEVAECSEKQCINLDDDDDIMLIDDDTNKDEKKEQQDTEAATEKNKESDSTNDPDSKVILLTNVENKIPEEKLEIENESTKSLQCDDEKALSSQPKDEKPVESVEEKPEKSKSLIPGDLFRSYRKNLADMTRDDLEEFCILKIVESIIDRSNLNEIRSKLKAMGQTIEEYKKKALMLTKQNRDLQVVLKSVQEEQKKSNGTHPITPLKITRSVGMQVLMTDKNRKRITPLQTPPNVVNHTNQANNRNVRNTPQSPRNTPQKAVNTHTIPVPKLVPASPIANKSAPGITNYANVVKPPAIQNGVKNISPAPKPEKRTHNRMQSQSSSVTVDLTDDEPPTKIPTKSSPAPPVRLVNQQNLIAPRQQFSQQVNSPRKVFIPISINGPQPQNVRASQTIMLKTVPNQAQRTRGPGPSLVRAPQNVPVRRLGGARHPAPLPDVMKQYQPPNWKALPPAPDLKLSKVENGIVISWKIEGYQEDSYEEIASYQLYAYQETSAPPSTNLWKKIGDVKALPLPMACTLTQFMAGYKYYFAVRAVDIRSRLGPFSLPGSILLLNKM